MPSMDGFQFIERLRSIAQFKSLPVIMLTSDETVEAELQGLNAGADTFLRKSEDPRVLALHAKRLVDRALGRR
jgi:DNA-binding response OmpR family regulator